jgi:hypothetical protein
MHYITMRNGDDTEWLRANLKFAPHEEVLIIVIFMDVRKFFITSPPNNVCPV